jgi:hypothetical protein
MARKLRVNYCGAVYQVLNRESVHPRHDPISAQDKADAALARVRTCKRYRFVLG